MLHNTGHYSPNEAPINMGTPINMTPMSGHLNITHNINNLSKIAHQGVPGPSGHYNLPDYAHYNHSPIGMPSQMGQFPSYQQLGFQHSYMNQNANNMNDLPFTNGMFPMNLNIQNEHNANMMYAYDKRVLESVRQESFKEQNLRKMPLNIPQIPNKLYNKQIGGNNDLIHNNIYEETEHNPDLSMKTQHNPDLSMKTLLNPDLSMKTQHNPDLSIKTQHNSDLSTKTQHNSDLRMKTQEKLQINSTRRKNIENTVKLIEDILIHASNKPKEVPEHNSTVPYTEKTDISSGVTIENVTKTSTNITDINTDPLAPSSPNLTIEGSNKDSVKPNPTENDSTPKRKAENELASDDEELKPVEITQHFIREDAEVTTDNSIVIKVEKASWADSECYTPFLKDCHGFERDEHMNYIIIEGEDSIAEAIASYKNDIKPEGVFECPHCALLFKDPKRFIIHNKWHTFGLTNIKRMEVARVREQKRMERKEAKIVERMNSKEVTDIKVDGKVFPCKDCDKVFSAKGSLKNHRQRTHPKRIRECKICHKVISCWTALRAHLATHSADSGLGFQCSDCPKRFKYMHSLAKHSDTHLEKVHACKDCPKKFGSQALLKMHMKTHERVLRGATFRCTYCGKGFFESYSLQVHERTHRNERPYTCDICNTSFGTNSSLKRHLKVSHNTAKPHQCSVCRRNFSTESIRDRHELRLHGNPEDFKFPCKQCACKYLKLKDLQKHVYKMHPKGKRKKKVQVSDSE